MDSGYLDDAPESTGAETEVSEADDTPELTEDTEGQQPDAAADTRTASINSLAKKYGLDPNLPRDMKVLQALATQQKRMEDKDSHIQSLRGKLTPFEQQLQEQDGAAPVERTAAPVSDQPVRTAGTAAEDPYPHWRGPEDAMNDWVAAVTDGHDKKDYRKATDVFRHMVHRMIAPYVQGATQHMVDQGISQFEKNTLGDVLPVVRQTAAERQSAGNRQFAEEQLRHDPEFSADIDNMRKPLTANYIKFEGQNFPDTAMNRILRDKPHILRIRVEHENRKTAEVLTYMEQMRAIRQEMASQKMSPKQSKGLIKAGVEMARRENGQERARQSLNGGSSAGGGGKPANGDYVAELMANRPKRLSDYK